MSPKPFYVTETGMAASDAVRTADGRVDDRDRIAFLHDYLLAAREAVDAGIPLHG